jgi:hypothetical protein
VGAHGPPVALGADGVRHLGQPGGAGLGVLDVGDVAVSQPDEVVDNEGGAGGVVVGDRVVDGGESVPADDHGGHVAGDAFEPRPGRDGGDQDQAVHAAVDHRLDDLGLGGFAVAVARSQEDLVVGVVQGLGEALEDVGEERVAQVGHHHPDGVGLAAHRPGPRVRPVAQLGDRRLHLGPHGGAGPVGVAQHLGHGGGGHLGMPGDVDDGDTPGLWFHPVSSEPARGTLSLSVGGPAPVTAM